MKNKNGISLIVLVITIVVVIILAAAVILSLSGNNPINNARIANLDQTKDSIESSILAYSGKAESQTLGYYTVPELLTGNRSETVEYSIIGDKETTNNDDETIYNIDKNKFESKIDTLPSTPTSNGQWYVDGNGKIYLVYDKKESMPKWMLNKDGNIYVMGVGYNGYVDYYDYNNGNIGFRPIVCLKSNIKVENNVDGSVTLE